MNIAPELEMYREGTQEIWPLDWTNPVTAAATIASFTATVGGGVILIFQAWSWPFLVVYGGMVAYAGKSTADGWRHKNSRSNCLLSLDTERSRLRVYPYIKIEEDKTSSIRGEHALEAPFSDVKGVAVIEVRVNLGSVRHRRYKDLADLWLLLSGNRKEKVLLRAEPAYAKKMQSWLCERTGAVPTNHLHLEAP